MKHLFLFIALICASAAAAAPKAHADIDMTDGRRYEAVALDKLPDGWSEEVKIVVDGRKVKIPSDSIASMTIWHTENPDSRVILHWMEYGDWGMNDGSYHAAMEKGKPAKKWFALRAAGPEMSFWISVLKLKPSSKRFVVEMTKAHYFLLKKSAPFAVSVPRNVFKPALTRTWLAAFLADDEVLAAEATAEKDLNRSFLGQQNMDSPAIFEHIAETYTPGRRR